MASWTTEWLHKREVAGDAYKLQPAIHVSTHEGRIFRGGALDKVSDVVTGSRAGVNRAANVPLRLW